MSLPIISGLARTRVRTRLTAFPRLMTAAPTTRKMSSLAFSTRTQVKVIDAGFYKCEKIGFEEYQIHRSTTRCPFSTTTVRSKEGNPSKAARQESILSALEALKTSKKVTEETEFSSNPYELDRHGRGESHHRGYNIQNDDGEEVTPDVIVRPRTAHDVSVILRFCNDHRIPVIPYGAGTSVEGHVCAVKNGTISLDMNAFQNIVLPGEENDGSDGDEAALLPDPIAKVGAGVTRKALNEALRHTGMQFVVDPGADASIGGMVATGASGTTAVRYGTMRENILELECVLADGTIVTQVGTKALKSSAGYDLVGLMCGSEVCMRIV